MKRDYELIFIVHPDLEKSAFEEMIERVKGWVEEAGGDVSKVDMWGKRRMAYPIDKKTEGQYVLLETQIPPTSVVEIERNLRLVEPIIRFLITQKV